MCVCEVPAAKQRYNYSYGSPSYYRKSERNTKLSAYSLLALHLTFGVISEKHIFDVKLLM